MTFEDAIKKAVQQYYDRMDFEEYNKTSDKKFKYSMDYFDKIEEETLGSVEKEDD